MAQYLASFAQSLLIYGPFPFHPSSINLEAHNKVHSSSSRRCQNNLLLSAQQIPHKHHHLIASDCLKLWMEMEQLVLDDSCWEDCPRMMKIDEERDDPLKRVCGAQKGRSKCKGWESESAESAQLSWPNHFGQPICANIVTFPRSSPVQSLPLLFVISPTMF